MTLFLVCIFVCFVCFVFLEKQKCAGTPNYYTTDFINFINY